MLGCLQLLAVKKRPELQSSKGCMLLTSWLKAMVGGINKQLFPIPTGELLTFLVALTHFYATADPVLVLKASCNIFFFLTISGVAYAHLD